MESFRGLLFYAIVWEMSHIEIDPYEVQAALKNVSRGFYEAELARRGLGERPIDEEDTGDNITTKGFRHVQTTTHLHGSALSLREDTLIRHQTFTLPEEITQRNVEALMYKRPLATVAFIAININELSVGFLGKERIKAPIVFAYKRVSQPEHMRLHPETEGITRYLNGKLSPVDDTTHLEKILGETLKYIGNVRFEESAYIDSVLETMYSQWNSWEG